MVYPGKETALYCDHILTQNILTRKKCHSFFCQTLFLFALPFSPLSSGSISTNSFNMCSVTLLVVSGSQHATMTNHIFIVFVGLFVWILSAHFLNLILTFVSPANSFCFTSIMKLLSLCVLCALFMCLTNMSICLHLHVVWKKKMLMFPIPLKYATSHLMNDLGASTLAFSLYAKQRFVSVWTCNFGGEGHSKAGFYKLQLQTVQYVYTL